MALTEPALTPGTRVPLFGHDGMCVLARAIFFPKWEKQEKEVFMGVLRDKTTGKWYFRFRFQGREFEKYFGKGPQGKADAELAYAEIRNDLLLAKRVDEGWESFAKLKKAQRPRTFAEAAADYMIGRAGGKASSIRSYSNIFKQRLLPEFGRVFLKDITDLRVRAFQVKLAQSLKCKGEQNVLSPRRVNNIMQLLNSVLEQEFKNGNIARNPCLGIKKRQEPKRKIRPFSDEELQRALSFIPLHYRPFFIVLANTGARPNELHALRWSDIDWSKKTISITKGRVRGQEGLPKTQAGEREIPMTPPVEEALRELAKRQLVSQQGFIFITKKGTPIDDHIDRFWRSALRKAKIPHRPSYTLRHTFVTRCINNGLPLLYIAKLIGHSTIDTLIRHYSEWIESATKDNAAAVERLRKAFTFDCSPPQQVNPEEAGSKVGSETGSVEKKCEIRKLKLSEDDTLTQNFRRGWDSEPLRLK